MNIFVVAYCGYIELDSPILLVTQDIELAKKIAKEASFSDEDLCSDMVIEKWDEKGRYYGIVEYN